MTKEPQHSLDLQRLTESREIQYNISNFTLGDMLHIALTLRPATEGESTVEAAANKLCRLFYDGLVDPQGKRACALVRFYKTHRFADLPADLQQFAAASLAPLTPHADTNCLTLLATAGDESAWNSRSRSRSHQAIPLTSPEAIASAPMISQLIKEFGMDVREVVRRSTEIVRDLKGKDYGVFYVAQTSGSPFIPAQSDFVERYGIKSVLGFGGTLGTGDLFAVILFSKAPIFEAATDHFRRLAADIRVALGRFRSTAIFTGGRFS